jgi:hypothetical protein
MVQLSATRCSCIGIVWVSLVSFGAITLCVASSRVFIFVVYFFIDSVRKLLSTPTDRPTLCCAIVTVGLWEFYVLSVPTKLTNNIAAKGKVERMFFTRESGWWKQLQLPRRKRRAKCIRMRDSKREKERRLGLFWSPPYPRHTFPEYHELRTQPPSGGLFYNTPLQLVHPSLELSHVLKSPLIKAAFKCDDIRECYFLFLKCNGLKRLATLPSSPAMC